MNTKTSNWVRRLAGVTALLMVYTSFVSQASARILFQDDTVGNFESDTLNIGSNDAGAVNTSIKFGADGTASENGVINWNITTNTFEVDHTTAITGGVSATGQVNFSGATGFRMRETANHATAACTTVNELIVNTTTNTMYICTVTGTPGTWASTTSSASDFEAVYSTDADDTLTTSNGAFTIAAGSGVVAVDSTGGIELNDGINGAVKIGTGTSTGTVSIGGTGAQTLDIGNGAGAKTVNVGSNNTTSATTILSGSGAVNVNANNNQPTNIGTGTSTGLVSIGGGAGTMAIDTTSWDITNAGVGSGFTGFASTGTVNFSGASAFRVREVAGITNPGTACTTVGELIVDNVTGQLYTCNNAGTDAWTAVNSGGDATTLDTLDSTQFLRSDTSDNFTSGTLTLDSGTTLTVNGVATIGDNGDTVAVNSSDWDISTTGAMTGIASIAGDDNQSTLNTNINVLTPDAIPHTLAFQIDGFTALSIAATGDGAGSVGARTVMIGSSAAADTVAIGDANAILSMDSATWDISTAGAASGFTTVDASGNFTTSAGTFCVGTTCLNETTSAVDSGAFIVGAFDEFDNSASTTVQGVLNDLDSKIGPNAPNVNELNFHPEFPDSVLFTDGTNNNGTLLAEYDSVNRRQYYRWSTEKNALHDIDLRFRYELPADFVATGDLTAAIRTVTTLNTDNKVDVVIRNETDNTTCATSAANVSGVANTWSTVTVTAATLNAGCSAGNVLAAGKTIEIQLKFYADNTNLGASDVGAINLDYTN